MGTICSAHVIAGILSGFPICHVAGARISAPDQFCTGADGNDPDCHFCIIDAVQEDKLNAAATALFTETNNKKK
ncbi:hypothetical protein GCM10011403_28550 [Pseudohongiella nitratireducens]|uniref:Uncharacterized protein n=1 Tax=Pseudohongiella nitratireducens TaxID=1768907 RepID=A0A916VK50_9GAMM|nr:hypothetical protein GCM10011403_28550 [Pseudohongiella nitratireducens]